MPSPEAAFNEAQVQAARQLIEKGNSLRSAGASTLEETLAVYDQAAALVSPLCTSETSPYCDDLASALTNKGITLLGAGSISAIEQAIQCFNLAVALRAPLAASGDPFFKYNLIGVWINRGDACSRTGRPDGAEEAIRSYDEAIRAGDGLDCQLQAEFPRRVALAHLGRGTVLGRSSKTESLDAACRSFDTSLAILGAANEGAGLIAAAAWAGKAAALEQQGQHREARTCALRAIELVHPLEAANRDAALIGLKARLELCAISTRGLLSQNASGLQRTEAAEALEAAEEGLRVVLRWPSEPAFSPFSSELFRFGSLAYAVLQPRFLREYIQEFLPKLGADSEPALRLIAMESVNEALGRLAAKGIEFTGLTDDDLRTFQELREALERLSSPGK